MKSSILLLSIVFAASMTTAAEAAHHARHQHKVAPATASMNDWAATPYMDSSYAQRAAFFRDAFNPLGAK